MFHEYLYDLICLWLLYNYKKIIIILLTCYDCSLTENLKLVSSLRAEISLYQKNNSELQQLNQVLKDEHQALQLAFTKLEEKLRKSQVIYFFILSSG